MVSVCLSLKWYWLCERQPSRVDGSVWSVHVFPGLCGFPSGPLLIFCSPKTHRLIGVSQLLIVYGNVSVCQLRISGVKWYLFVYVHIIKRSNH